jgi:hypothetical protein
MMRHLKISRALRGAAGIVAVGVALAASQGAGYGQAGPFSGLEGSWSGGGTVKMENGGSERIRCRVSYAVSGGGNNVRQDMRCASDSYNFNLTSNVAARGSSISGTWSETSRRVGGSITGTASGGTIQALAEGSAFSVRLTVTTRGNQQSVTIRSASSDIREVSMSVRKN